MTVPQGITFAYLFIPEQKIRTVKPRFVRSTEEVLKGFGRIVSDFHDPIDSKIKIVPEAYFFYA